MEKKYGTQDSSYLAAGEEAGIRLLVDRFYEEMDSLPEAKTIRAMHQQNLEEVKDKLACFLCGWLGGPKLFQEKYGPIFIPLAHAAFPVGPAERDAWLLCMERALAQIPYEDDFKTYLMAQLSIPAERIRNRE